MKIRGSRRLVKRLGLALAVAALVAPSAQAVVPAEESGSLISIQPRLYADDLHTSLSASPLSTTPRLYADDLHASSLVAVEPRRGYAPINTRVRLEVPPVSSEVVSASSSFDWGDAGIGAGIMFALVGFGAAILARQTRRSRLSAV